MRFDPEQPLGDRFRDTITAVLITFADQQQVVFDQIGAEVQPLFDQARSLIGGGKRFRPAFCYWGYAAVAGQPEPADPVLAAAASLDLLHVSALVHDDVIDDSDTRRGDPAAHLLIAELHRQAGWRGSSERFGRAGAILLGDLLLIWSAQLWAASGFDQQALRRARPALDAVRAEVTLGQYLDIIAQHAETSLDRSRRVNEFKSARYTVARPAQVGALLAGAEPDLVDALGRFGSCLGRAFQMRDDLLGVYGDVSVTGKPAGDDIREGKQTVLVAYALEQASPAAAARLAGLLGDPDLDPAGVATARQIIDESGAVRRVEADIATDHAQAMAALAAARLDSDARIALDALGRLAVTRDA